MTRLQLAILSFGIVNASLYSALLPLWEGFDEPAHYGYVESLWQTHRLPILGRTTFPTDVIASFRFAPASYLMHRWLPETTPYEQWFALSRAEREHRRAQLDSLRADPGANTQTNYEAHHPPLAYLPLSLIDRFISGSPITARILIIRLFAAICSAGLLFFGAVALCRELALAEPFACALMFSVFSSQMFYGATAHVTNDWLAIPLATWLFAGVAAYINKPGLRRSLAAAAWLALGLLTKAYFLAFALWAAAVVVAMIWRGYTRLKPMLLGTALVVVVAGPWYARNAVLYGNVSGTYEAFTGVGIKQALAAAPRINWPAAAGILARGSLWMGNNSGTSFSRATLYMILVLLFLAIAAWACRSTQIRPAEQTVFAGIAIFIVAIAYAACSAFACRDCSFREASPWYTQVLLVPLLALAYLGMSRWNRLGRGLAIGVVALWTWVLFATWTVKLFPMYSGAGSAPMHVRDVWDWYAHHATARATDLSLTAQAPAPVLYGGLLVSITLAAVLSIAVIRSLKSARPLTGLLAQELQRSTDSQRKEEPFASAPDTKNAGRLRSPRHLRDVRRHLSTPAEEDCAG